MPLHVRHLYLKAVVYGLLLAASAILAALLAWAGEGWAEIALAFAAGVLIYIAAGQLFDRLALYRNKAKPIGVGDLPHIIPMVEGLCKGKGLKMPCIAVLRNQAADLFVSGHSRESAMIFISPRLGEEFDDKELEILLAYELSKIDELGSFAYNLTIGAFSTGVRLVGRIRLPGPGEKTPPGSQTDGPAVRTAGLSDIPTAVKLLVNGEMYGYFTLHDLNRLSKERSPYFLVAKEGGKVVGCLIGETRGLFGRTVHLCKIVVDERSQGRGIGHRLMSAFVGAIEGAGCGSCLVEVREDNIKAISLYEKFGFKRAALIPRYYPDGSACIKMVRVFE